jgi:uncharacterized protein
MGALNDDVEDIKTVVKYLTEIYGYTIDLLIGHSRGSLVSMRWICTTEEGRTIRGFVNVSGRYRMEVCQSHCSSDTDSKFSLACLR